MSEINAERPRWDLKAGDQPTMLDDFAASPMGDDDWPGSDFVVRFAQEHHEIAAPWPYAHCKAAVAAADTLHQLADTLIEVAAQSPTVIAGGLLVAARALLDYTERQVEGARG